MVHSEHSEVKSIVAELRQVEDCMRTWNADAEWLHLANASVDVLTASRASLSMGNDSVPAELYSLANLIREPDVYAATRSRDLVVMARAASSLTEHRRWRK